MTDIKALIIRLEEIKQKMKCRNITLETLWVNQSEVEELIFMLKEQEKKEQNDMSIANDLKEQLDSILQTMEDRGFKTYMVGMNRAEIELVRDMLDAEEDMPDEYAAGYQYGYKRAIKDVARVVKGMEWHGGSKQTDGADGVP